MKFTCNKENLDHQLQYISRVVTVRSNAPVLSNVLLETDGAYLRLTGTDMELTVSTYLQAQVEQEGTFTVPAKLLQEFVHQNPDEELEFSLESYELICASSKVKASLSGLDANEFPSLPKVEHGKRLTLPLPELLQALRQVIIACAADQSRPVLTGVLLHVEDATVTLASTDSFRLVERKITTIPIQDPLTIIIPARTIQEVIRIATSLPAVKEAELEISDQQLVCRIGTVELFSRLISGVFPRYQAIIPTKFAVQADVATPELVQALRLSNVFGTGGVANVMVEVSEDGTLSLASHGSQRGKAQHTLYAVVDEPHTPLKVAFNTKFLLDAVQAPGVSHIKLQFAGPTAPLLITTEDPNYRQLVMPIRLDQ